MATFAKGLQVGLVVFLPTLCHGQNMVNFVGPVVATDAKGIMGQIPEPEFLPTRIITARVGVGSFPVGGLALPPFVPGWLMWGWH